MVLPLNLTNFNELVTLNATEHGEGLYGALDKILHGGNVIVSLFTVDGVISDDFDSVEGRCPQEEERQLGVQVKALTVVSHEQWLRECHIARLDERLQPHGDMSNELVILIIYHLDRQLVVGQKFVNQKVEAFLPNGIRGEILDNTSLFLSAQLEDDKWRRFANGLWRLGHIIGRV